MSDQQTVTFETSEGTKVTCSPELAKRFGYTGEDKAPAKRSTSSKSTKK